MKSMKRSAMQLNKEKVDLPLNPNFFTGSLRQWFLANKRDLPWREQPTPYAVWISEVMLQQTQVAVVIPYFERWLSLFPDIKTLAEASLDQVIKAWEGLGYYSRARNLHAASQYIVECFQGNLPDKEEELKKIKGLGPYTIGAILSFAFHQKCAAVDGNVIRVLTRYFNISEDISRPKTVERLRSLAFSLLPDEEHWIINEALIELGATVCKKKPNCGDCPLRPSCQSYAQGTSSHLPFKSQKVKSQKLFRVVPVLCSDRHLLVKKGEKGKVMSDLYQFPFFESEQLSGKECCALIKKKWGIIAKGHDVLQSVVHGFTRYQATLFPILLWVEGMPAVADYEWKEIEDLKKFAFSSGHRKIFRDVCEQLSQALVLP